MSDKQQDKEKTPEKKIGKKLVKILNGILTTGEWNSSLFLRNIKKQLEIIRDEANSIVEEKSELEKTGAPSLFPIQRPTAEGYIKIYILIYLVESSNLQNWLSLIKSLTEYSVNRPTYRNEEYAREFIRSKKDAEHYGYAIINIKEDNIYQLEKQPVDAFGHKLLILKEKAIKVENIFEFVHANKKRYVFQDNDLTYIEEQ